MKKTLLCVISILLVALPHLAKTFDERTLPLEIAKTKPMDKAAVSIQAYANKRDVLVIGGVMSVTYHFCTERKAEFCSDQEGILIVSGASTGNVPEMLRTLDKAIQDKNKILVRLSKESRVMGVSEILDVELLNSSI